MAQPVKRSDGVPSKLEPRREMKRSFENGEQTNARLSKP
jgi:hypothetical protein